MGLFWAKGLIKPNEIYYLSSCIVKRLQKWQKVRFSVPLIFEDGFVGDIAFIIKEEIFPKSPLALF